MTSPDGFIPVASLDALPPGAVTSVQVGDEALVLVNAEGTVYALSAWCSHLGSSLALGSLRQHSLTCFAHLWTYDVRSGEPLWPPMARVAPGYRLRTYPVQVREGTIYVLASSGPVPNSS